MSAASSGPASTTPPGGPDDDVVGERPRWRYGRRGHALWRSLSQLRARPLSSATTLLALGASLALPALLLFTADAVGALGERALEGESLTLYLDPAMAESEGAALARALAERGEVRRARHVTRDEALATLREHADVDAALEALGENPLPGSVVVYPARRTLETGGVETLADELGALPGVERVQLDLLWVQRLRATLALARLVATLLGAFLVLTALLVIANTVRLELARRRPEIEVCRLLGAGPIFVHRPVIYTGLLYGVLGGLVACLLALVALALLRAPLAELAALYGRELALGWPSARDLALVPLVSGGLGGLGAGLILYGASRDKVYTDT